MQKVPKRVEMALNGERVTSEDSDHLVVYEITELIESKWVKKLRVENVS